MKEIFFLALIGLPGCLVFYFRRPISLAAEKIGIPPFFRGDQEARIRLFGMIGIVHALITFGIGGLIIVTHRM